MDSTALLQSHSRPFYRLLLSLLLVNLHFAAMSQQPPASNPSDAILAPVPDHLAPGDSLLLRDRAIHAADAGIQPKRVWMIAGIHALAYGGSLVVLNNTWYKGYQRTGFHVFNDSGEWNQVDKTGHAWSAYNGSKVSSAMWESTGIPHRKAVLFGGLGSLAYLTGIEYMDAHSAKWGWSWSDITANISGAAIFTTQELLWGSQRIQYKFSFHKKDYGDPLLVTRADDLFGEAWYERMLKDYNAQTYWLSFNLHSFLPSAQLPPWLNIAAGYGADGMYGGFENRWVDKLGNDIDRRWIPRTRQYYLAPDIDFTKIPTNKKWLRTAFTFLNAFKCPAPAIMLDSKGKIRAFLFYF